jgi:signal peptidase II
LKKIYAFGIVILVLLADQILKIYVKSNFTVGEEVNMAGNWARLHFLENRGMAWGMTIFGGAGGKLVLTIFRFIACVFGIYYLNKMFKEKQHKGFIICVSLILAGAIGNLIDSMFYGLMFDRGLYWDSVANKEIGRFYEGVAQLNWKGYTSFLNGSVVDMFYFPLFDAKWPNWLPVIGGDQFEFFAPVFNLADAAISIGVITIIMFQNRFFNKINVETHPTIETHTDVNDTAQVS